MAEVEEDEANWLDLPDHILELIIDKLNLNFFDYIRCGATCVSWQTVFLDYAPKQFPPLLLIPTPDHNDDAKKINKKKHKTKSRSFYSASDNKVYDHDCFQVRMPRYRQCRGSGNSGWLITVDDLKTSYSIRLFNPLLSHEILLPPLETFPNYPVESIRSYTYLQKAVLSADPLLNPDDYIVMAIFSEIKWLAFYKPGDKAWTQIQLLAFRKPDDIKAWSSIKNPCGFNDIIYYKGKFHAIDYDGEVVVCYPEHRAARSLYLVPGKEDEKEEEEEEMRTEPTKKYLVHISNKVLMQVHRGYKVDHNKVNGRTYSCSTTGFKVYKLGNVNKWVPVKSLGDHALIIGENNCISISTSDYPRSLIKPNCIYYLYMEDPYHCPDDMGVYNLEDGSFERHYHLPGISSIYPVPIWIQPSLTKKRQQQ